MAERPNINELFRRAMEINLRFYEGFVELSVNYLTSLSSIFVDSPSQSSAEFRPPVRSQTGSSALVLEAEAGEQARGYFLVENQLSRKVSAEILAPPIIDADGQEVEQKIYFEPSKITLEQGEKMVIQVVADIDEGLEPGVGYRGSITVPGLSKSSADIVVRRRHSVEGSDKIKKPPPKKPKNRTSTRRGNQPSRRKKKQA